MRMCDHCGELLEEDFTGECPSCGTLLSADDAETQKAVLVQASGHVSTLASGEGSEPAIPVDPDAEPHDMASWLEYHELEHLAVAFAEQNLDLETLEHVSPTDLAEMGLPLGDRKKVLLALDRDPNEIAEPADISRPLIPTRQLLLISALVLAVCFFAPWSMVGGEPAFAWDLIDQAAGVLRLEVMLLPFASVLFLTLTSTESPLVARKITAVAVSVTALVIFFWSEEMEIISDAAQAGVFGLGIHVTLLYIGMAAIAVAALVWAFRPQSVLARVLGGMALAAIVITYIIPLRIKGFDSSTSLFDVLRAGLGTAHGTEQLLLAYLLVPLALSLAFIPLFIAAEDGARGRQIYAKALSYAAILYLPAALATANIMWLVQGGAPAFVFLILAVVIGIYGLLFTTGVSGLLLDSRDSVRRRLPPPDAVASLEHQGIISAEESADLLTRLEER